MTNVNMGEAKRILNHTIDTNIKQQENGKMPVAIGLQGDAGIGKTSLIEQVAKERGMGYTTLVLSQLDEAGDLVGFPLTEYECQVKQRYKDAEGNVKVKVLPEPVWINAKQLDNMDNPNIKYVQTGKTRMSYAKPAWVPEYNENGNILALDDYSRANPSLLNACMEIIRTQGYVSWHLPKKTTVVISTNPDDGRYNVSSQDEAQEGRYAIFDVSFDLNAWEKWAEKYGLDGRCINFVSSYSQELFGADDNGNHICNPRSFVMFSDLISSIDDWDDAENLSFITTISKGCFKDEEGRFSKMFNSFIRNKMHLLPQPKDMLLKDWATERSILEAAVYDQNGQYRPDIASLLERRFTNFIGAWLSSDEKTPIAKVEKRIEEFLDNAEKSGKKLFPKDVVYHMIKVITSENRKQTNKLLLNPKLAKAIA